MTERRNYVDIHKLRIIAFDEGEGKPDFGLWFSIADVPGVHGYRQENSTFL